MFLFSKGQYQMKILLILLFLFFPENIFSDVSPTIKTTIEVSARVEVGNTLGSAVAIGHFKEFTIWVSNDHVCQWSRGRDGDLPKYNSDLNSVETYLTTLVNDSFEELFAVVAYTTNSTHPSNSTSKNKAENDLCFLLSFGTHPIAKFSDSLEIGDKIISTSSLRGHFPFIVEGHISVPYNSNVGISSIKLDGGSSGSGLFDIDNASLKGIVFAVSKSEMSGDGYVLFTYFIPASIVRFYLEYIIEDLNSNPGD